MLNNIQKEILNIFIVFKHICSKYDLKYFAIGGTCIGAIRHHGFIPWDDDLDVAMPIDDYLKFILVCKKELKKTSYSILNTYKLYHVEFSFCKLQKDSTTFIEDSVKPYVGRYTGIFIDVFPICGLPKSSFKREQIIRQNMLYHKFDIRMRLPLRHKKTLKWIIPWILIQPIKIFKRFYYFTDKRWELFKRYKYDESQYIYFPWRPIPNKDETYQDIFYREDFENPIEVPFENTTICVPNGYDRYLKMDFGDYMKLPPVDQQVGNHPAFVDLNTPFKYYADLMRQGKLNWKELERKNKK